MIEGSDQEHYDLLVEMIKCIDPFEQSTLVQILIDTCLVDITNFNSALVFRTKLKDFKFKLLK